MAKTTSKTFKRAYREDIVRELEVPGMGYQIFQSFRLIFKNWKVFLPFLIIEVAVIAFLMGVISEATLYDAAAMVIMTVAIITTWLFTIFVLRHTMAGQKVSFSDAAFNSMTPMNAVLVLLLLAAVQTVPVILVIIAYSSAVETHFLDTPFYAFLFLVFSFLMLLLSGYLLSSTVMAMVAVSAPGIYPIQAVKATNEVMMGRRIKFMLRLIALLIVLGVMWAIVVWPVAAMLPGTPVFSVVLYTLGCISVMYTATYFYLYYRWMISFDGVDFSFKKEKSSKRK